MNYIEQLWRRLSWLTRLDVILLLLMFSYAVIVLSHVWLHKDSPKTNALGRLNSQLHTLRGIAAIAPYLGLAGTCIGILDGFGYGVAMETHAFFRMIEGG